MSNKSIDSLKTLIAFILLGFLIFVFIENRNKNRIFFKNGILMDTFVEIRVEGKEGKKALDACWNRLEELSNKFDKFSKNSEIYSINQNSGKWVKVSKDTLDLLRKAFYFAKLTDGIFDPTIAPVVRLWGFYDRNYKVPSEKEINENLRKVSYKKVYIKDSAVFIPKDAEIDLGGIAKGYIIDKLLEILKNYNIERAILNIGGQVGIYGKPLEDNIWKIKIRDPRNLEGYIGTVYLDKISIATSGDYERFFVKGNKRYCHIIDPRNGYPADQVMSVSVISESATEADVMSTVFFVLGKESIKKWKEKFSHLGLIIFFKDGSLWYSPDVRFVRNEDK